MNFKKAVLVTALFCSTIGAFSSHADPEDRARMRQCQSTDATCAGEVVLGAIEKMEERLSMRGGRGHGPGCGPGFGSPVQLVEKTVEFYEYENCSLLKGTIKMSNDWDENLLRCKRFLSTFSTGVAENTTIRSVKIGDKCQVISGTNLALACPRVAQP